MLEHIVHGYEGRTRPPGDELANRSAVMTSTPSCSRANREGEIARLDAGCLPASALSLGEQIADPAAHVEEAAPFGRVAVDPCQPAPSRCPLATLFSHVVE